MESNLQSVFEALSVLFERIYENGLTFFTLEIAVGDIDPNDPTVSIQTVG